MSLHPLSTGAATARPSATRVSLALAALASVFIVAAHVVRPDVDPTWAPISDLALGEHGWLMTAGFLVWGAAGLAAAAAWGDRMRGRWERAMLVLFVVAAAGPILAGLFPGEPVSAPDPATGSVSATLHGIGAMLPDALLPASVILAVVLWRRRAPRTARWMAVLAALVVWVVAIALGVAMGVLLSEPGATLGPDTPLGLLNRVHVAVCLGYLAVVAVLADGVAPRKPRASREQVPGGDLDRRLGDGSIRHLSSPHGGQQSR